MKIIKLLSIALSFLPFMLLAFKSNNSANTPKEKRCNQFAMPLVAIIYSIIMFFLLNKLSDLLLNLFLGLAKIFEMVSFLSFIGNGIRNLYTSWGIFLEVVLFNTAALTVYVTLKKILTAIMKKITINENSFIGSLVEIFYYYDENDEAWYIKDHFGQARSYLKTAYYGICGISVVGMLVTFYLCMENLVSEPYYPFFSIIIVGEFAFFIDGLQKDEKADLIVQKDKSRHFAFYAKLRKPLMDLFGDKLSTGGITVNESGSAINSVEDILMNIEKEGGNLANNYSMFIRKLMDGGLKPNVDYVRSGYDLANGKSLLFNTPFYDKLNPYVFYSMNHELLNSGKILVVLGQHGSENDLKNWLDEGMGELAHIPNIWKIEVLSKDRNEEEELPDIGIITRSGVHDLKIHRVFKDFLQKVSFVMIIEPSKLVTTAQVGLHMLMKCCGKERQVTYCSIDRNCDGLVDSLSHILMTNITEVSATEHPHGISSYMCWTADDDYLQHRIVPGISRFLGLGTELSMVALKNQIKNAIWYGCETFPVIDAHWIAKQYYYELLSYAKLPKNQETFDEYFKTSFNICNQRVSNLAFLTVEDDRKNLFETRRNFATITEQQGFVNVISNEYMMREYMTSNPEIFRVDPKAIPYIAADYVRTRRNAILSLCLLLCVEDIEEKVLLRQLELQGMDTENPLLELWKEICIIFGKEDITKSSGVPDLIYTKPSGEELVFEKDETILLKREYRPDSGEYENIYTIEDEKFYSVILDDLQNAKYISEEEDVDNFIGSELKGHVYQKYLPGQFFTLNGKYYEMVTTTADNRILVRRASDHINGRLTYRQLRNYTIHSVEDSKTMGDLKTINDIDVYYQFADFSVDTKGYWKQKAYNDFDASDLISLNNVPSRNYHHKQILKLDFSKFGDEFNDDVRVTLTNLLNELFVSLFAENQPFICALTNGSFTAPLTYSLDFDEEQEGKYIYIVEDSQLDLGLLGAVERNISRILQMISDYLSWNDEMIEESLKVKEVKIEKKETQEFNVYEDNKKEPFFKRIGGWFKKLFKKKNKEGQEAGEEGLTPKEKRKAERKAKQEERRKKLEESGKQPFFKRIIEFIKNLFKKKKKDEDKDKTDSDVPNEETATTEENDDNIVEEKNDDENSEEVVSEEETESEAEEDEEEADDQMSEEDSEVEDSEEENESTPIEDDSLDEEGKVEEDE